MTENESKLEALLEHQDNTAGEIAELEKAIAEEKKPKLRHGEVRHWPDASEKCYGGLYSVYDAVNDKHIVIAGNKDRNGYENMTGVSNSKHVCYLADDLTALSKPLANFSLDVHDYSYNPQFGSSPIKIAGNWHTIEEADEFIMNMRRLIATAKKSK